MNHMTKKVTIHIKDCLISYSIFAVDFWMKLYYFGRGGGCNSVRSSAVTSMQSCTEHPPSPVWLPSCALAPSLPSLLPVMMLLLSGNFLLGLPTASRPDRPIQIGQYDYSRGWFQVLCKSQSPESFKQDNIEFQSLDKVFFWSFYYAGVSVNANSVKKKQQQTTAK